MHFYKYLLPALAVFLAATVSLPAANDSNPNEHLEELNERDLAALRDFLHRKRSGDLLDKLTNLTIAGDVRTEWRHMTEKICGRQLRGSGFRDAAGIPYSKNDFDIELNFIIEYETDRAWCVAHLDYDNSAGIDPNCCCCDDDAGDDCVRTCPIAPERMRVCHHHKNKNRRWHGSGSHDDIDLKRAFIGYEIYADSCTETEIVAELGRRKMYDVFESDIQFLSRFDALVLEAGTKLEWAHKIYGKVAGFVVDERVNHFAWAAEVGLLNINDWGLDFKYSIVDWCRSGDDRCDRPFGKSFNYLNSQVILTYTFDPKFLCKMPTSIYAAALWNHAAKHQSAKALGWYAGFLIGDVEHEGDWSLELEYQWVGSEAVAYDDQNGIGLGDLLADFCNGPGPTQGYKGWQLDSVYLLTDNLAIDTTLQWAISNEDIKHTFSAVEVEAVYAF